MKTEKGQLLSDLVVMAAVLLVFIVAIITASQLSLIVSEEAGETEDILIEGKTASDYVLTYGRFAMVSSLHSTIYSNGQQGGAPGRSLWREGRTVTATDREEVRTALYDGTMDRLEGYMGDLESEGWTVEQGPAFVLETDVQKVNGTFAAFLRREDKAPSVTAENEAMVGDIENVETRYLRLHEIGVTMAENGEGLLDARIHRAVRETEDHDEGGRDSCDKPDSWCNQEPSSCGAFDTSCESQIEGDPHSEVVSAMEEFEGELNDSFGGEDVGFRIEVGGEVTSELVEKEALIGEEEAAFQKYDEEEATRERTYTVCKEGGTFKDADTCSISAYTNLAECDFPWVSKDNYQKVGDKDCGTGSIYGVEVPQTCFMHQDIVDECMPGKTEEKTVEETYTRKGCFGEPCTCEYCDERHYDMVYEYSYTVTVSVIDEETTLFTGDGKKRPEMVFEMEGVELLDNECQNGDHKCKEDPEMPAFSPDPKLEEKNIGDVDWSSDIEEDRRGEIPEELEVPPEEDEVEREPEEPEGPALPTERIMFVASGDEDGDLGGIQGADSLCQDYASGSDIEEVSDNTGDFRALISTSGRNARDIPVTGTNERITNTCGDLLALDWDSLWDGDLRNAVRCNEDGNEVSSDDVWTGSNSNGEFKGAPTTQNSCDDWTSTGSGANQYRGRIGNALTGGSRWIDDTVQGCGSPPSPHLYCVYTGEVAEEEQKTCSELGGSCSSSLDCPSGHKRVTNTNCDTVCCTPEE